MLSFLWLKLKNLFAKHIPLAEKFFQEFINSEEGKKAIEDIKNSQDKEVAIKAILVLLLDKIKTLAENNPKIVEKVLNYLRKRFLTIIRK